MTHAEAGKLGGRGKKAGREIKRDKLSNRAQGRADRLARDHPDTSG